MDVKPVCNRAEAFFQLAIEAWEKNGNIRQAKHFFEQCLNIRKNHDHTRYNLGLIAWYYERDFTKANRFFSSIKSKHLDVTWFKIRYSEIGDEGRHEIDNLCRQTKDKMCQAEYARCVYEGFGTRQYSKKRAMDIFDSIKENEPGYGMALFYKSKELKCEKLLKKSADLGYEEACWNYHRSISSDADKIVYLKKIIDLRGVLYDRAWDALIDIYKELDDFEEANRFFIKHYSMYTFLPEEHINKSISFSLVKRILYFYHDNEQVLTKLKMFLCRNEYLYGIKCFVIKETKKRPSLIFESFLWYVEKDLSREEYTLILEAYAKLGSLNCQLELYKISGNKWKDIVEMAETKNFIPAKRYIIHKTYNSRCLKELLKAKKFFEEIYPDMEQADHDELTEYVTILKTLTEIFTPCEEEILN